LKEKKGFPVAGLIMAGQSMPTLRHQSRKARLSSDCSRMIGQVPLTSAVRVSRITVLFATISPFPGTSNGTPRNSIRATAFRYSAQWPITSGRTESRSRSYSAAQPSQSEKQ
jgi:hypothetical protein